MKRVPAASQFLIFFLRFAPLVSFLILELNCAGQGPPSGGSPDSTPPTVVSTFPEQNTTDFRGNRLVFEFSEYVDRRSVEDAFFVSPSLGPLEFEWSGREVEVAFDQPLREQITYVVTIGTDVKDVRAGNRMTESFTLAFSTGAHIDSAAIEGRVFDEKAEGLTVLAYNLSRWSSDSLDPAVCKPDYATQTGKGGAFRLEHLAWGTYRILVIRDQYKNLLYDPQVDEYGVLTRDVELNRDRPFVPGLQSRMTKEDTTRPFLLDARAFERNLARMRFSEPVNPFDLVSGSVVITDTTTSESISILDISYMIRPPSTVLLTTGDLDSANTYRLVVESVRDTAGNLISTKSNAAIFRGSDTRDTTKPYVFSMSVSDSARDIAFDASLSLTFSEPVVRSSFEHGFRLVDSTGSDVEGMFRWESSGRVMFLPSRPLLPFAWYRIRIVLDSLCDRSGNHFVDSVFSRAFQTITTRKLGSIRGIVDDRLSNDSSLVYVFATSVTDKLAAPRAIELARPGSFEFTDLPEGKYQLSAFRDSNGDGRFGYGKPFSFAPAERFAVYPDTVKVRARWPLEGVVIRFEGE
jgi:hypothetical protein